EFDMNRNESDIEPDLLIRLKDLRFIMRKYTTLQIWTIGIPPKYHYVFKLVPQWQAEKKGHVVLFGHVNLAMFF
ncbi:hypothetical protein, partial [Bartonella sp. CL27QHWL]|uniref:hypothetical protein n=1 Tax=Bartonella sp. CL27QHWL TaxID=3243521 RepID=UPI0035D04FC0